MSNAIAKVVTRSVKRGLFRVKKHSPEILTAVGIACGIGATVSACKATLKAKDILEQAKQDIDAIHRAQADPDLAEDCGYESENMQRDLTRVYVRTGTELAKVYAPAMILGAGSIFGTIGSSIIMHNRVNTAVAACAAIDAAFSQYRDRVAEAIGAGEELEIYHDVKAIDPEKNSDLVLRPAECDADRSNVTVDGYSIYARCFDEYNPNWRDNAEYNLSTLRNIQMYLNKKLERDGYLFLNDAYRELGFEPTQAGQLVGWIYDPDREDTGDNCVSFGLYDPKRGAVLGDFINGREKSVFLDFNVDGVIIDRI